MEGWPLLPLQAEDVLTIKVYSDPPRLKQKHKEEKARLKLLAKGMDNDKDQSKNKSNDKDNHKDKDNNKDGVVGDGNQEGQGLDPGPILPKEPTDYAAAAATAAAIVAAAPPSYHPPTTARSSFGQEGAISHHPATISRAAVAVTETNNLAPSTTVPQQEQQQKEQQQSSTRPLRRSIVWAEDGPIPGQQQQPDINSANVIAAATTSIAAAASAIANVSDVNGVSTTLTTIPPVPAEGQELGEGPADMSTNGMAATSRSINNSTNQNPTTDAPSDPLLSPLLSPHLSPHLGSNIDAVASAGDAIVGGVDGAPNGEVAAAANVPKKKKRRNPQGSMAASFFTKERVGVHHGERPNPLGSATLIGEFSMTVKVDG